MPGQRIAAVAGFRETPWGSPDDAELFDLDPNPDIERAAGTFPAIGAVAIIGGADLSAIFVPHGAAETSAGYESGRLAGISCDSGEAADIEAGALLWLLTIDR